jgi:hypothetical protein
MRLPTTLAPRVADEHRKKLGDFLAGASLYDALEIPGTWKPNDNVENVLPAEIQRDCESSKCENLGALGWKVASLTQNIYAPDADDG